MSKRKRKVDGLEGSKEEAILAKMSRQLRTSGDATLKRIGKNLRDRSCGDCSMCCTVKSVTDVTEANEDCKHLCGGKCGIYQTRPQLCRSYLCAWRSGHGPDHARPSLIGAFVDLDFWRPNESGGSATVRFSGPYKHAPAMLVLSDLAYLSGITHVGFTDPDTDQGSPYVLFSNPDAIEAAFKMSGSTGKAPWNGHHKKPIDEVVVDLLGVKG